MINLRAAQAEQFLEAARNLDREHPMNNRVRDRISLVIMGLVIAAIAFIFWNQLQQDAFLVLATIAIIGICGSNRRLRRQLREKN